MFPAKILHIEPLNKQSNQCHSDTEALSASVSKNKKNEFQFQPKLALCGPDPELQRD